MFKSGQENESSDEKRNMKKEIQKINIENDEREIAEAFAHVKSEIIAPISLLETILVDADSYQEAVPTVSRVWMMPRFFVPIGFAVFMILAGTGYKSLTTVVPVAYVDSYKSATDSLKSEIAQEEARLGAGDPDFLNDDELAILSLSNEI